MPSGAIITTLGLAKLASATPLNQLNISALAVGDGNGGYPTLDPSMTALANEVWRGTPSPPIRDPNSPNVLIFEAVIPPSVGGFTVREQAIFDDAGDMIAIGQTSVVEKPLPNAATGVMLTVRLHIQLDNAEQVDLFFQDDPTISAGNVSNANGGSVQDFIDDYQVHTRTFANVDAMLAFNGLVIGQRYNTGGTTWEYFGGGNTIDKFKPITPVYVTDFGADNTGEVDSAAVIHYVCSIFDDVYFPTGIYIHEVTLKPIDRNNQRLEFEEGAVLKHTGVGVAVQFGRDDQSARYDCKFINPFIIGNSNTTDGLLWQALSHCYAETTNVRDCNGAGIRLLWGVDNIFNGYNISSNEGVFNVMPTYGVRIGRTIVGNYSVGNIFLNAVIEGVSSDGIWIEEGNHNQFIGGTSENNGSGYAISDISFGNEFKNVWCEENTNYDVNDLGIGTVIDNCYNGSNSPSQANVTANGSGLIITKGWCRHIDLSAIGRDTRFENVRFSDNPSLGIQGTGTKQIRGCLKADVNGNITGTYPNETGSSGTFTPTMQGGAVAGANTYSVQKGTWTREGNEVHYNIDIEIAAKDAAMTGGVIIGPFPFQAASLGMSQAACVSYHSLVSTTGGRDNITAEMLDANLYLQLWGCQAGASASVIDSSGIVNGTRIKISGFYEVQ